MSLAPPPEEPRSGWIDAACLAWIVVVYRGLHEELEGVWDSGLLEHGFIGLALRQLAQGFRAELLERCGVAAAALALLALSAWLVRRIWSGAPRGLPRRASRALRLAAAVALALPASVELAALGQRAIARRPPANVVLIVVDTLRADHLGVYGYGGETSPRLDAFSREAFVFEHAISNASWTRPAVASLLTSQTPLELGIYSESRRDALARDTPTLQKLLGSHGYRTAAFLTSGHYKAGLDRSFDSLWNEPARAEVVYEQVFSFLDHVGGERFFLLVHNGDPHDAFSYREGFSTRPASSTLRSTSQLLSAPDGAKLFDSPDGGAKRLSPPEVAELEDNYDGEIRYLDHHLGRFFDELERRGLLGETIVVVTADHGEEFFDHGSWWHGGSLHGELLHVPLILRVPGMGPGRITAWVSGIDLLPTLAELVGARPPETARGRSLVPLLRGQPVEAAPILSATGFRRTGVLSSVIVDGYKLIRSPSGETLGLYDLARDEDERASLVDDAALEARLLAAFPEPDAIAPGGQAPPMELDAPTRAALEALGYVTDPRPK